MRSLILLLILMPLSLFADEDTINWKTFQSDYGYEFKYPSCWRVEINSPDEKGDLKKVNDLVVEYTENCANSSQALNRQAAFAFEYRPLKSVSDRKREFLKLKEDSIFNLKNGSWIFFKKENEMGLERYIYIEHFTKLKTYLRWNSHTICPHGTIYSVGPMIFNPDESLLTSIKLGDLSIPSPEKTIYESIRCIDPKIKKTKK